MLRTATGLLVGLAATCSAAAQTSERMKVDLSLADNVVTFKMGKGATVDAEATVSVTGPGDFFLVTQTKGGEPRIDFREIGLEDGIYNYQITAPSDETVSVSEARQRLDDGRDGTGDMKPRVPVSTSGTFRIEKGEVVLAKEPERAENGDDRDR